MKTKTQFNTELLFESSKQNDVLVMVVDPIAQQLYAEVSANADYSVSV